MATTTMHVETHFFCAEVRCMRLLFARWLKLGKAPPNSAPTVGGSRLLFDPRAVLELELFRPWVHLCAMREQHLASLMLFVTDGQG